MLDAMGSAEVDCIRYRGADGGVARALCEHGLAGQIENAAVRDEVAASVDIADLPPNVREVIQASAVRRLGRPTLIGFAVLLIVVLVGVAASVAWMRWGQ